MKHTKGVKRYGARYGLSIKKKLSKIESLKKSEEVCPYCGYHALERLAVGIWHCKKCGRKFTGKAYSVSKAKEEA